MSYEVLSFLISKSKVSVWGIGSLFLLFPQMTVTFLLLKYYTNRWKGVVSLNSFPTAYVYSYTKSSYSARIKVKPIIVYKGNSTDILY